jgi:hypothetical protein
VKRPALLALLLGACRQRSATGPQALEAPAEACHLRFELSGDQLRIKNGDQWPCALEVSLRMGSTEMAFHSNSPAQQLAPDGGVPPHGELSIPTSRFEKKAQVIDRVATVACTTDPRGCRP